MEVSVERLCECLNLTKEEGINFIQNHKILSYYDLGKIFSLNGITIKKICDYLNLEK